MMPVLGQQEARPAPTREARPAPTREARPAPTREARPPARPDARAPLGDASDASFDPFTAGGKWSQGNTTVRPDTTPAQVDAEIQSLSRRRGNEERIKGLKIIKAQIIKHAPDARGAYNPGTRPPARDARPPARDTRPPARDARPPARDTRPPARDARPPARDARPPARDPR